MNIENNFFIMYDYIPYKTRVCVLSDVEKISRETNCVKSFIAKGIALACFIYARCLDLGRGIDKDQEQAKNLYKRVSVYIKHIIIT